ncbi:MAG: DUF4823 domain-containing protein [Cellvibrionaceae bacterium]
MQVRSFMVALSLCVLLSACAGRSGEFAYQETSFAGLLGQAEHLSRRGWVLSGHASILVAPFPASDLTDRERQALQTALVAELDKGFLRVDSAENETSLTAALFTAQQGSHHYLMVPSITDSVDGLSGLQELLDNPYVPNIEPDRLTVKLALYNVPAAKLIDVSLVQVQGSRLTWDNQTPLALASDAFELYAKRLNAVPHP